MIIDSCVIEPSVEFDYGMVPYHTCTYHAVARANVVTYGTYHTITTYLPGN